ncbi:hypothetical protein [Streptomyces sp. H27-S2]|uniref:hypothetical protein n=1 Tax=Streptomyces antarcticus TaxID=2996458 RepID=UPI0022706786|nr:hypothetical protein [Streptomyces sp. H27-S2]MCY0952093.1 hypothetical protein [Streptomyces sp. H27-S2]
MPDTPEKPVSYPGRPELDQANARFRRAAARLHKEAAKYDPDLMPALAGIVAEAAEHLARLASDLEAAESSSARNKRVLKAAEDKMRAGWKAAARRGDPRALRMLEQLDRRARDRAE